MSAVIEFDLQTFGSRKNSRSGTLEGSATHSYGLSQGGFCVEPESTQYCAKSPSVPGPDIGAAS